MPRNKFHATERREKKKAFRHYIATEIENARPEDIREALDYLLAVLAATQKSGVSFRVPGQQLSDDWLITEAKSQMTRLLNADDRKDGWKPPKTKKRETIGL